MANFKNFGNSEFLQASDIFRYLAEGRMTSIAEDYFGTLDDIYMDTDGNVFAIDENYNYVTINPDYNALDLWIILPDSDGEGFLADLVEDLSEMSDEDGDYLKQFSEYLTDDMLEIVNA
jgi:hypothetical protein